MVRNTFAVLGILAVLVMSLGLVSASVLTLENLTAIPSSINHGEEISIPLSVNYTGHSSNTTLSWTGIPSNFWTLPSLDTTSNTSASNTTAKFKVPQYYSPGTINAELEDSGSSTSTLPFTIIVNASPSLSISLKSPLTRTENGTINVTNTGNVNLQNISLQTSGSAGFSVQFNDSGFSLDAGKSVLVKASSDDVENLNFRDGNSLSVKATNGTLDSNAITLSVVNSFYNGENPGDLTASIDRINVKSGFGDNEQYWYPLDNIELRIRVENNGNWNMRDINLKFCLLDNQRKTCVLDQSDMDIGENGFYLNSGNNKNVLVDFEVNPNNLMSGNTDYTLYVSAVGKVSDRNSQYYNNKTGTSVSSAIEIRTDENFVILNKIALTDPSNYLNTNETTCGDNVKVSANVWNVGDNDLNNNEVFVEIYNRELGIQKVVSFNQGINSMDLASLATTITIPKDTKDGIYPIKFNVYNNKDLADSHIYKDQNGDNSEFYHLLTVANCSYSVEPLISASLSSEAKVGKELVITATITNNGGDNNFVVSASGFGGWANLLTIEPQVLSIKKDSTGTAIIKLTPTKEGFQTFNINAIVGGKSYNQSVSVNIAKSEPQGIFTGVSKPVLYLLFGIGAVLLLILLTLAFKIFRKPRKKAEF